MGAGRDPRPGGIDDLLHEGACHRLVGSLGRGQEGRHPLLDDASHQTAHRRGAQHLLGLALELRFGETHRHHGRQALQDVVLDDLLGRLEDPRPLQACVEGSQQALLEPLDMGASLGSGDDVDEGAHRGVVPGAPAQGDVHLEVAVDVGRRHATVLVEHRNGLGEGGSTLQPHDVIDRLVIGEVLGELGDTTVEAHRLGNGLDDVAGLRISLDPTFVGDDDLQTRNEESRLTSTIGKLGPRQLGIRQEDLPVRPVAHPGTGGSALGLADLAHPGLGGEGGIGAVPVEGTGDTASEAHPPHRGLAVHLDVQTGGDGIDDRCAHAVQTA